MTFTHLKHILSIIFFSFLSGAGEAHALQCRVVLLVLSDLRCAKFKKLEAHSFNFFSITSLFCCNQVQSSRVSTMKKKKLFTLLLLSLEFHQKPFVGYISIVLSFYYYFCNIWIRYLTRQLMICGARERRMGEENSPLRRRRYDTLEHPTGFELAKSSA